VTAMKILVTGKNGQLGYELAEMFRHVGEVIAFDRDALDLAKPETIAATVSEIKPALILNAAAYTAVDLAEKEKDTAVAINAIAPGVLAEQANRLNIPIVHYSTDYVFDGNSTTPYVESDATGPLGMYGKSKLAGEIAVATTAKQHLIMRVSWLYGNRRQNFMLTMLRLMRERETLSVVSDQIGCPTWVRLPARATKAAIAFEGARASLAMPSGIYHVAPRGVTSWHGFASAIQQHIHDPERKVSLVTPITTAQYPTPAKRPAYSVLNSEKIERALGITMPAWEDELIACAKERG
jgi:dTDP-4-dehydrorhamnose reductase